MKYYIIKFIKDIKIGSVCYSSGDSIMIEYDIYNHPLYESIKDFTEITEIDSYSEEAFIYRKTNIQRKLNLTDEEIIVLAKILIRAHNS